MTRLIQGQKHLYSDALVHLKPWSLSAASGGSALITMPFEVTPVYLTINLSASESKGTIEAKTLLSRLGVLKCLPFL